MPNICENELYVVGPKKHIERFKKKAKWKLKEEEINQGITICEETEGDLILNKLIPFEPGTDLVEFYGTKWNCIGHLINYELDAREIEQELVYEIDSAWAPPTEWLRKVSEKFKKLKFTLEYTEPGMGFKGIATAEKGIMEIEELEFTNDENNDEENE
jgi:hypothetical protein